MVNFTPRSLSPGEGTPVELNRKLAGPQNQSLLLELNLILGVKVKVKLSRYRPGVAQKVGRGIALLFHDRSTPRPHFTPEKDPVPILQEAGWAPGPVWTGGKSRPRRDSIPDCPARSSVAIPTELPGPLILGV